MLQPDRAGIIISMEDSPGAKILILTNRQDSARRWAEMLRPLDIELWSSSDDVPSGERPDVIVTDFVEIDHDTGVVRIGGDARADVSLPPDVTARELQLACRLLAQIVRLRRRQHRDAEQRRRLTAEALTDPLTELPNRRAWDQTLAQRLGEARGTQALCLAVFDLDHFKQINDRHGHAAGDAVLRASGQTIREELRQHDFVARVGGDEFAALMWVADSATAAKVVDRVRTALPDRLAHKALHVVAASAGYHVVGPENTSGRIPSADESYAAADAALHEAKRQGRDRTIGR